MDENQLSLSCRKSRDRPSALDVRAALGFAFAQSVNRRRTVGSR
jgi:hypothetical protein